MYKVLFPILLICIVLIIGYKYKQSVIETETENFDGTGLVYNQFPNWFLKKPYDPKDWLVNVYPDRIQPSCLPYSVISKWGSLENMNYNSQAYRFWRF